MIMNKTKSAFAGTVRRVVGTLGFFLFWIVVFVLFGIPGVLLAGLGYNFGLFVTYRIANDVLNDQGPKGKS